jgi:UDP-N-acetylmuramoyl-tripeptide--D-alanyl-D-alanine ligase
VSKSEKRLLEQLAELDGKKMAVLGDMFELGDVALQKHREITDLLKKLKIPAYLIGETFGKTVQNEFVKGVFPDVRHFKQKIDLSSFKDYTVLIKASRGMRLETLLEK